MRTLNHDVRDLVLVLIEHFLALGNLVLQMHELVVHDETWMRHSAILAHMTSFIRFSRLMCIDGRR